MTPFEDTDSGYADLLLVLRIDCFIQTDGLSRGQYSPLEISATLAFLDFAGISKQTATVMVVVISTSRHPCCRVRTTFQERNQTDTSSFIHQFHPAFFMASQVRLSGAEAANHADISSADHLTAPPIRIGAGILPQLLSRNTCRLLRLSISPSAFALSS